MKEKRQAGHGGTRGPWPRWDATCLHLLGIAGNLYNMQFISP